MNESEIVKALRSIYRKGEWVVLPQLRDSTGARQLRTADAVAINCWPSRGMEVHGFEVKTYRGDWLRELKTPEKAESIYRFCDRWWIVTPEPVGGHAVVLADEVPPTWGYMTVSESGVVSTVTKGPILNPVQLDRTFIASIFRSFEKHETEDAIAEAARKEGYNAGLTAGKRLAYGHEDLADHVRWRREELKDLEKKAKRILEDIRRDLKETSTEEDAA